MKKKKTIQNFMDSTNRVKVWPAKKLSKLLVLEFLISKFQREVNYSEADVNSILNKHHSFDDCSLLRRELFENGFLGRTRDCRKYWVN